MLHDRPRFLDRRDVVSTVSGNSCFMSVSENKLRFNERRERKQCCAADTSSVVHCQLRLHECLVAVELRWIDEFHIRVGYLIGIDTDAREHAFLGESMCLTAVFTAKVEPATPTNDSLVNLVTPDLTYVARYDGTLMRTLGLRRPHEWNRHRRRVRPRQRTCRELPLVTRLYVLDGEDTLPPTVAIGLRCLGRLRAVGGHRDVHARWDSLLAVLGWPLTGSCVMIL